MAKNKKEIVQRMKDQFEEAVIESELKEGFLWERARQSREKGDEKTANQFQMKVAALKQKREDEYETFLEYLKNQ